MKIATSKAAPSTRPSASAWLDTSIAAAVTRCSVITANSACRSVASGVVSSLGAVSGPTLVSMPPIRPVTWPDIRSPDSSR